MQRHDCKDANPEGENNLKCICRTINSKIWKEQTELSQTPELVLSASVDSSGKHNCQHKDCFFPSEEIKKYTFVSMLCQALRYKVCLEKKQD